MPLIEVDIDLDDIDLDDLIDEVECRLDRGKSLSTIEEQSLNNLIDTIKKKYSVKIGEPQQTLQEYFKNKFLKELSDKYTEEQLQEMETYYKSKKS